MATSGDKVPNWVKGAREWSVERSNPASLRLFHRKKIGRIRIEIRRNPEQGLGHEGYHDLELGSHVSSGSKLMESGDVAVLHLFKESHGKVEAASEDEHSVSSNSTASTIGVIEEIDDFRRAAPSESIVQGHWEVKLSVPISKVHLRRDKEKCHAEFQIKGKIKSIDLHFKSEKESRDFLSFVKILKKNVRDVAMDDMQKDRQTVSQTEVTAPIQFLIEIISATDLKNVDLLSKSDPYVVVKFGGVKVHSTSVIENELDPIWAFDTKSLFIFTLHPENYYSHDLIFEVRDKGIRTSPAVLGQAVLSNKEILRASGDRIEFKLKNLHTGDDAQGYLAIRCKRAKKSDIDFVNSLQVNRSLTKHLHSDFATPHIGNQKALPHQRTRVKNGVKYHLARPVQEDHDELWLTSEQINKKANEPSLYWTEIGDGNVGELFVEVIGCDGLPNMDSRSFVPRDETDSFVTCVFEEAVITTDVVKDSLNPRFMPWSRRAFNFHIQHSYSSLFIGVFDHDRGVNPHDLIGRLSIPITSFAPGTTYDVSYDLYDTHQSSDREKSGSVKLRIRLEWNSQRKLFFEALSPKDADFTINLDSKKNFGHTKDTVRGDPDVMEYSFKTLLSLLEELKSFQVVYFEIVDGLKNLWLWRGHWEIKLLWCIPLNIPLNSILMLAFAVVITEFPKYTVSVFFATIAWIMLALLHKQRLQPSPWGKPPTYVALLAQFITNKERPVTIEKFSEAEANVAFLKKSKSRRKEQLETTEKFWENFFEDMDLSDEMAWTSIEANQRRLRKGKFKLFKGVLFPIQQELLTLCTKLRFVSQVLTWDQKYVSFWITTKAILVAILLSVVTFYVWDVVFLWGKRIVLYTLCGPWNKLFDVYYYKKLDSLTNEEKEQLKNEKEKERRNRFRDSFREDQLRKERLVKEQAMKRLMFGKEIVVVPDEFTPERFEAMPRAESCAYPNKASPKQEVKSSEKRGSLFGQNLNMEMIPSDYFDRARAAEEGSHGNTPLLDRNSSRDNGKKYGSIDP